MPDFRTIAQSRSIDRQELSYGHETTHSRPLGAGFTMMSEGGDTPAAKIAIPVELTRLAAIPIASEGSFQIDPVVHECIRLFNANYQGCEYCQNARAAGRSAGRSRRDMVVEAHALRIERPARAHQGGAALSRMPLSSGPQTLTQADVGRRAAASTASRRSSTSCCCPCTRPAAR